MMVHGEDSGMRLLLKQMFQGWILHEASWQPAEKDYARHKCDCMVEACGGDFIRGNLIYLFDYWDNDIQHLAPHYGIFLARDEEGKLFIREDIPAAPSPEHLWVDEHWEAPSPESAEVDGVIVYGGGVAGA